MKGVICTSVGIKISLEETLRVGNVVISSGFVGNLLSIVGVDGNNHIFDIAYVAVDVDNKDNWKWFLTLLHEDLGDYVQNRWNFMSDMQKV